MQGEKTELEVFGERRSLWLACLGGNDRNSIGGQMRRLIWNAATFRVVNEARRIAPKHADGTPRLSGLVHEFINNGFFAYQSMAVRRLADTYPVEGKRGVYSLVALLKDLKKHAHLFTRANMLAAQAPSPAMEPFETHRRNREIDWLTGVNFRARTDSDRVRPQIFDQLMTRVKDACGELGQYADQYIAHASTPESRADRGTDLLKITLGHIYHAHKVFCQTVNFVSASLLGDTHFGFLATAQFDLFKDIECPLVEPDRKAELEMHWKAIDEEIESWGNWGIRECDAERDADQS